MDEQEALRRLGRLLDPADVDRERGAAWERIRALARDEAQGVVLDSSLPRDAQRSAPDRGGDEPGERIRRAAERGLEPLDPWGPERGEELDHGEEWFGRGGRDEPGIDR